MDTDYSGLALRFAKVKSEADKHREKESGLFIRTSDDLYRAVSKKVAPPLEVIEGALIEAYRRGASDARAQAESDKRAAIKGAIDALELTFKRFIEEHRKRTNS